MKLQNKHTCQNEGCTNEAHECTLDTMEGEIKLFYYCDDHVYQNGFCTGCYDFWGGIEDFEFGSCSQMKLCPNCYDVLTCDDDDDDDDDEWEYDEC